MNKPKKNKGITLIALIISIIILLILAVVSISAVTGDGIIAKAKQARTEYEQAQDEEQTTIDSYLAKIDDATKVKWTQDKTTVTNGDITLEVGDYVDYKANVEGYNDTNGWRVLGAEDGELLLISSSAVVIGFRLEGAEDYLNDTGIGKLNAACEPYGKGNYATKARSVNVDDINRVTGYDPTNTGEGKTYGSGEVNQYGNKVTYSLVKDDSGTVTGVKYESDVKSGTSTSYTTFRKPGESTNITKAYTVESTYYYYYPHSLTTSSDTTEDCKGISTSSNAYKAIYLQRDGTSNDVYWLGSPCVTGDEGCTYYCIRVVFDGQVNAGTLWNSSLGDCEGDLTVRAVVSLKSDVKLSPNGANSWKLS